MKKFPTEKITITAKELAFIPDFAHYSERTLYRKYRQMRERLEIPKKERLLTKFEVLDCLGKQNIYDELDH